MKRSLPRDTRDCLVCLNPAELCGHHADAPAAKLRVKVAAQKRTIRRLRKALTVARNRFKSMEMGTFTDECSAALKPRTKR